MNRRVAVITGGSQGIGQGIVWELANRGYDIAFSYRSAKAPAMELRRRVREKTGVRCECYYAEMRNRGEGPAFIEKAAKEMDGLDVLVNNAGMTRFESILDLTEETVEALISLDLKNYLFCMQAAAGIMVKHHTRGSIINITSTRAERAYPADGLYGGVKAAINRISQSAALDLAPYHIRVNCVAPGAIVIRSKEQLKKLPGAPVEFWDKLGEKIPLQRSGMPQDVARAVAFLASSEADYITGITLRVDGGLILPGMPEGGEQAAWGKRATGNAELKQKEEEA